MLAHNIDWQTLIADLDYVPSFSGHQALPDAENLKRLFTKSPLKKLLAKMPRKDYEEQRMDCKYAWHAKKVQKAYKIKPHQAKRLVDCGLSKLRLERMYQDSATNYDFNRAILRCGLNSFAVREKILHHLSSQHEH